MWRSKRMRLYKARFGLVFAMIATMLVVWFCLSFVDVNVHSLNDPQNEGNWNLFKISQTLK